MDGCSRKIMLLKVGHVDKKQKKLGIFIEYLHVNGIPKCMRMDLGSKIAVITDLQNLLFHISSEYSP